MEDIQSRILSTKYLVKTYTWLDPGTPTLRQFFLESPGMRLIRSIIPKAY